MSHFSPEREQEIEFELWEWWNDFDWSEKIDRIDPEGTGEFIRLLEFAEETQKNHERCCVREGGARRIIDKRRFDETTTVLNVLNEYLWDLAEKRGVVEEKTGELLTRRRD